MNPMRQPYLHQLPEDPYASLYAIANAARFHGLTTPEPGTATWRDLIEAGQGMDGIIREVFDVYYALGLAAKPSKSYFPAHPWPGLPVKMTIRHHQGQQVALWIGDEGEGAARQLRLLNAFAHEGPLEALISAAEVHVPPHPADMQIALYPIGAAWRE